MNDKIIATSIGAAALLIAVTIAVFFAPYHSCVRSLTDTPVVGGTGLYSNALAARVCAGRLGGGGGD